MDKMTFLASTPQELIDYLTNEMLPYAASLIAAENNRKTYLDSAIDQQNEIIAEFNNQKTIADASIERYAKGRQKLEEIIAKLEEEINS